MTAAFINSFQSEWIKKRRSLATWLVVLGSFFTPAIIIVARIIRHKGLPLVYAAPDFWEKHWRNTWESMALFLLPVGVIMATSLVTQLEYKNNTWKQLHTTPLSLTTIYFSKLTVIVAMMLQFFLLFNVGIYVSAILPSLLFSEVPFPAEQINVLFFLKENALYFIDCMPIIALQYLISLRYKNFLVPVGMGFLLWVGSLGSLVWKYGYVIPYTYCMYNYLKTEPVSKAVMPTVNFHLVAIGYTAVILLVGYGLYITNKEKG
jgi:lantibiotic transport system permease protein